MKVELVGYTQDALELLLFTKSIRLAGKEQTLEDIKAWPMEKKLEHLAYMRDTIKSSWEFVDYTFKISEVTRAFTHQFVRTRSNSYAQESQRTVDVSEHGWLTPDGLDIGQQLRFDTSINSSLREYDFFLSEGVHPSKARGLLPTNIHTSIIAKVNLRSISQMAEVRLCTRTQGEYQDVFRAMRAEVLKVHPWAEDFINVWCVQHGTCYFPRYKECPVQRYTHHGESSDYHRRVLEEVKEQFWSTRHEATPVAFAGQTHGEQEPTKDGMDEPDGPWTEGWEERNGKTTKGRCTAMEDGAENFFNKEKK
jgi:thymidylate synthase (FAD)